jgi:DNA-binding GntR family transcriptional regulator
MNVQSSTPLISREGTTRTTQDLVALNLRHWVADGTLRPGDRINMEAVAESVGCSIIPVREALRVLAKENIITIVPHRGAFVRVLSPDEITEIYWIRQTLEARALGNAGPKLTPADFQTLLSMIEEMERVINAGNVLEYMTIDREFHLSMYRKHNSDYLMGLCTDAYHASHAYRLAHAALPGRASQGNREHRALVEALMRNDTPAAQAILQQHFADTASFLLNYVRQPDKPTP